MRAKPAPFKLGQYLKPGSYRANVYRKLTPKRILNLGVRRAGFRL